MRNRWPKAGMRMGFFMRACSYFVSTSGGVPITPLPCGRGLPARLASKSRGGKGEGDSLSTRLTRFTLTALAFALKQKAL